MSRFWTHRGWAWALVAHAAFVTLLTALFYVSVFTTAQEDGFNFGAGFIGFALLGLGLPWSLPALALDSDRLNGMSEIVRAGIYFGPAFLNVLVHGLVLLAVSRKQIPPGKRT